MSAPPPWRREIALPRLTREGALAAGLLALLALFFVHEAVLLGRVFYVRDINLQWYGQVEGFVAAVQAGSAPLWDPYVSFGQPLLANANNQLLYPFTWLNLVLRPGTYYAWFVLFHLVLAASGAYALGRALGTSRAAATAAAAIWMGSGPLLSLGSLWNHLAAAAWIPWVLLAGERALEGGGPARAIAWGAAVALQALTGSPDVGMMTLGLMGAQVAGRLWRARRDAASVRPLIGTTLLAALFAAGLSAGQVLPSLELARRAGRLALSLEERTYWSLHPLALLQAFLPVAWNETPLRPDRSAALFESREPLLFSIHLGVPALALALAAFAGAPRRLRATLAVAALLAVLFALGRHGPFYGAAVAVLPPLAALRFPSKSMILVGFAASMLAGMGLDAWSRREGGGRRGLLIALPPALLALACVAGRLTVGWWAPSLVQPPPGTTAEAAAAPLARALAWSAAASLGVLLLAAAGRRARWARATALATAALSVIGLAREHRGLNPTAPPVLLTVRPDLLAAVDQRDHRRLYVYDYLAEAGRSRQHLGRESAYTPVNLYAQLRQPWAAALANRLYLVPPVGAAWKVYDSYSRDNLGIQPTEIAQLMVALSFAEGGPAHRRLLQVGAVSQVAALHARGLEDLVPQAELPGPFLEPIRVFAVPGARPRTYVVDGTRVASGRAALDTLLDPAFDPAREVILPTGPARAPSPGFRGESRIVSLAADRVRLQASLASPGILVLVDTYDPGWKVRVDGRPAALLRANVGFRGVALEAGTHEVEMTYRPASVVAGLAVSGITLLLALGLGLRAKRAVTSAANTHTSADTATLRSS